MKIGRKTTNLIFEGRRSIFFITSRINFFYFKFPELENIFND